MKNKKAILSSAVLFFLASQVHAQISDSIKTNTVEEVVIVGSRSGSRTKTDSPVPVDVFNMKQQSVVLPQTTLSQILNNVAPSFSSTPQVAADGTDHVDPAQLRGLGPDQVLVLINGKRRHNSSLVNTNGSPGRGSVGTDLNAIPAFALERIEVLRDGAAAQYGSDAIAGVLNLGLKRDTGRLTGQFSYGGNLTPKADDHTGNFDGQNVQADLNYGAKIGNRGGFVNLTWSSQFREPTSRAGTESAPIFNAYNAIENRAMEGGVNLSSLYNNIGTVADAGQLLAYIRQYAAQVSYFTPELQSKIQSAATISAMQSALNPANFTTAQLNTLTDQELAYRGQNRKDYNMIVGQSRAANHQFFTNFELPVSDNWKVYAFGGYSIRTGDSGGFYRRPRESRTFTGTYVDGYLPHIGSSIEDISLAAGIKGKLAGWNVDLSNTLGRNAFDYHIKNTSNTSMRFNSPTEFNAGGFSFLQNTVNLDFSKPFDWFAGANVAFGAEHRYENYKINAGEEASYATYDVNGNVWNGLTARPTDFFGNALPGGSQVFGGFRPENGVNKNRNSVAAYGDVELNFTDRFLVDAALRYENYSDFGSTFNYKLASRVKLSDNLNLRFAGSTGFRAPSMAQIYFNQTSTFYTNGALNEQGTFSNDSRLAQLLNIGDLKQETSKSASVGFTYKVPSAALTFTIDSYFVRINDRIVLTDTFNKPAAAGEVQDIYNTLGITGARFFANAIDTETRGIDFVATHNLNRPAYRLQSTLALNVGDTHRVGPIHASEKLINAGLASSYFGDSSRVLLEEATPKMKASLSNELTFGKATVYLRNTYFGDTTDYNTVDVNGDGVISTDANGVRNEHQTIQGKLLTDLSFTYKFSKNIGLTVGANNLFDIYPTKYVKPSSNNDQFVYARASSQFGLNGRYVFSRLNFSF